MQFGDEFRYLRFDMIHIGIGRELEFIVVDGALLEFCECFLHVGAVIGLSLVFANREAASPYDHAIFDVRQSGL